MKSIHAALASVLALLGSAAPRADQTPRLVVPHAADVTIKTRGTADAPGSTVTTEILYLKGAWQRYQEILKFPDNPRAVPLYVTIARCDERRIIELNDREKTYASSRIDLPSARRRLWPSAAPAIPAGAAVDITTEFVETGERRQLGSRIARRVITTTTTDAAPEANARSGIVVEDAWYIDVPPRTCMDWGETRAVLSGLVVRLGSLPDSVHRTFRGMPPKGLVIESTVRTTAGEQRPTQRVTLIEYSEAPLDQSIFAVPATYRQALPRLSGGFDLTRPDTVPNRLRDYWEELSLWARSFWFRW